MEAMPLGHGSYRQLAMRWLYRDDPGGRKGQRDGGEALLL
jgi:hypothetical protein